VPRRGTSLQEKGGSAAARKIIAERTMASFRRMQARCLKMRSSNIDINDPTIRRRKG